VNQTLKKFHLGVLQKSVELLGVFAHMQVRPELNFLFRVPARLNNVSPRQNGPVGLDSGGLARSLQCIRCHKHAVANAADINDDKFLGLKSNFSPQPRNHYAQYSAIRPQYVH
jgi:hypothetical protein